MNLKADSLAPLEDKHRTDSKFPFEVAAFYVFEPLPQCAVLQKPLQAVCESHGAKGIILLATEGINGTLAAAPSAMPQLMADIRSITGFAGLSHKTSHAQTMPFRRLKVRLKREIVTINEDKANPLKQVGTYVEAEDWNALISDPDVLVIDTRNSFEHKLGTFKGAQDPGTTEFSQFPAYARETLQPHIHKKLAMFCTGGIRCEKATSLMLAEGFEEVYHLKGGILTYLERIAAEDSLWQGGCFVFDQRLSLGHGLEIQQVQLCQNCSSVINSEALQSPLYEEGVCCHICASTLTSEQKASARERHHQMKLAAAQGMSHLGPRTKP